MSYCRDERCVCHTSETHRVTTPFPTHYGVVDAINVIYCCTRCACLGEKEEPVAKGWKCPKCNGPVSEAKQVDKPGKWVVHAKCKACDMKIVITKSGTRVER